MSDQKQPAPRAEEVVAVSPIALQRMLIELEAVGNEQRTARVQMAGRLAQIEAEYSQTKKALADALAENEQLKNKLAGSTAPEIEG